MNNIKIGVVGTIRGMTFVKLLQVLGDKACLWAVCENNPEKIEAVKKEIPESVKVYENYDEFLNSGIDAVVLCNYFHEHASFAIKALEKGIYVLSDTTAAPTLGDCVKLCRAVEKYGDKYMLGANGPYKKCSQFMRKQYREGKIGTAFYAEAEYLHHSSKTPKPYADDSRHWRRMMPGTYYNMHTLGTLMYITETLPKTVSAKVITVGENAKLANKLIDHDGAKILCGMDNGATFDVTGCSYYGPTSKWFRIMGVDGVLETKRYDETEVLFTSSDNSFFPDEPIPEIEHYKPKYEELNMASEEEYAGYTDEQMRLGHGGIDFWLVMNFIKFIKGEFKPFFNVYRSTALSAAAILAWRSVLNGGLTYEVPDFTKEEDKKKYENDFYSPFADDDSEFLICRHANKE